MSLYDKTVEALGRLDGIKSLVEGYQNFANADNAADRFAIASQMAAEAAIGTITTASVRTAFSTLRLGLAVSGRIGQFEALSKALGIVGGIGAGKIIDAINDLKLGSKFYDWTHPDQGISDPFNAAQRWQPRRDPLILDLDGDGLETLAPSSTRPILFDHDGDGTKSGTGWIKADDGFLVLDRNSNGVIDNGTELFGDATPLYAGGKAADGFAALTQEDSNHDGKIDQQDSNWNQLRVWRDLNQDGMSQADELFTLDQLKIASMNTRLTTHSQVLENGNEIADLGTYVKADGTSATMGDVSRMADINLAEDTFHRQFSDYVPLADGVAELPEITGSGKVRDLHEAASLSPDLLKLLTRYNEATTRQEQLALLDELLVAWADTSGMAKTLQERSGSSYVVSYRAIGDRNAKNFAANSGGTTQGSGSTGVAVQPANWSAAVGQWERKLHILEAFNGRYFFNLPDTSQKTPGAVSGLTVGAANPNGSGAAVGVPLIVELSQDQINLLDKSYAALRRSVYNDLMLQTRFKPLLSQIDLVIEDEGIILDFSKVEHHFHDAIAQDPVNGLADLIIFNRSTKEMLAHIGWNGVGLMSQYMASMSDTPELLAMYVETEVSVVGQTGFSGNGSASDDVILASTTGGAIYGNANDDVIVGRQGIDILNGGDGADTLTGGTGNDKMDGDDGNDTYILSKGDGRDVISEYDYHDNTDTLLFTDVASTEITKVMRNGSDLELWYGSNDAVTISRYFSDPASRIELIKFSDDVTWKVEDVAFRVLGTEGNDWFPGISGVSNHMKGLGGNDTLTGQKLADILEGGTGNDILDGGDGADTLTGGTGNDKMDGDDGNDTYILSKGDGRDVISEYDYHDNTDTLLFTDVASTEITKVMRSGSDLELWYGPTDAVTISRYFSDPASRIELIKFSDDVVWKVEDIASRVLGTEGNDSFTGISGMSNSMKGLGGNDTLTGQKLADILDGGAGNDKMDGTDGNDTYILSKGDGRDMISEYDYHDNTDTLLFTDVASTEITKVMRNGSDLELWYGSNDAVTISRYFSVPASRIELIKFSDDVTWQVEDVASRVTGTEGNDSFTGISGMSNSMKGLGGNDTLTGQKLADILDGGAGNDILDGGDGADTVIGGTGNDKMDGDDGNDTYILSKGDGRDVISEYDYHDNTDTLLFTDVASTEITKVMRNGSDLELWYGSNDAVTISRYFSVPASRIELIKFSDDVTWQVEDVASRVTGTEGNDSFTGISGMSNSMKGLGGNDTLTGQKLADILEGGTGNDILDGGDGADTLTGGTGNDKMDGDDGNDTYILSKGDGRDVISEYDYHDNTDTLLFTDVASTEITKVMRNGSDLELWYGSNDAVTISRYFSVPASRIELIKFSDDVTWQVEDVASRVTGTEGNDSFTGISGMSNSMKGLGGNDTLTGQELADILDGGDGDDKLNGSNGNDTLIGGAGADTLSGGAGNDIYIVDNAGDVITEYVNEGVDTVQTNIHYTLPANVENLQFAGNGNVRGIGNVLDNVITGNAGNNTLSGLAGNDTIEGGAGDDVLDGGPGADSMAGGIGDDVYYVDHVGDLVIEHAGQGMDRVIARIDYVLGANAENLSLDGNASLSGTGNESDNLLTGNVADNKLIGGAGNDTLDGMQGSDILLGGAGNDTYYLLKFPFSSDAVDTILENANEGLDTVWSSFSYTLGANVENLILNPYDPSAVIGTGNELDNLITGNSAANRLNGGAGSDLLQGGAGADELTDTTGNNLLDGGADNDILIAGDSSDFLIGGTGNDTIATGGGADVVAFNRGDGKDVVIAGGNREDTLSLGHGIRYADLLFARSANDLILETGVNEQITLKDWYAGSGNHGIGKLQVIIEGTADYDPGSASSLNNKKIAQFDFDGLVAEYDKARAAVPALDRWAMSSALLNFHFGGSDTAAIGGDLAYQYAQHGNLSNISATPAQGLLRSPQFGSASHPLQPATSLP